MKTTCLRISVLVLMMIALASASGVSGSGSKGISLRDPFPLDLRYPVGETMCYRLLRHSTLFQMDGTRFGEQTALAYFTRTRLDNDSLGRAQERFTWKGFSFGQSLDPNQPPQMSPLKEAEGFAIVCSVQDEDAITKIDVTGLPGTLEGMWFMIMCWDALTFDGPVRSQEHFDFPAEAIIGTEVRSARRPYDFRFEYAPILSESRYSFSGNMRSKLLGVSVVDDTPCAVVEFSDSENVISMNLEYDPVRISNRGFEHFWGKTYLSLENGMILKGELVAPVIQVQDTQLPGQERPQHSEYLVLQKLHLDMLSRSEFDAELKENGFGARP